MNVLWLEQPACRELRLVGGKVANLSRLAGLHRVPTGFCLSTTAFERASAGAGPPASLPGDVRDWVVAAYGELARRCATETPSVAVRSSAVDEDGGVASFAGQHETFLNVIGADAVAEAVAGCWASAWSDRAQEYRRQQGLTTDRVQLAVLVQHLVQADVSAVVFSANPVTGNRDEVVVNASWGLGESVVGGTVTPDTFVIRKTDGAVVDRRVADKRRMTVPAPGGTREVDVPRFLRHQCSLEDEHLVAAVDLARALESTMGWPVDVECAWRDGELYLLQCRPITTLGRPSRAAETLEGAERA